MTKASNLIVDISNYQPVFNAAAYAKAGHTRIRIKATESTNYNAGSIYRSHVEAAHRAGVAVDHYHFMHAGNGTAQAKFFLSVVKSLLKPGDRLMLDCEVGGITNAAVGDFIAECNRQHPHVPGIIYGGPYFLRDNGIRSHHGWGLVLADYTTASNPVFWPPGFPGAPVEWQFTDKARVAGLPNPVDLSRVVHAVKAPAPVHNSPAPDTSTTTKVVDPKRKARHLTTAQRAALDEFVKQFSKRKHPPTATAKAHIQTAINVAAHARDIKP